MKRTNPNPGGRPAKFDEPSRPVTMTLPDRILDRLAEIGDDRAKAVVKAVEKGDINLVPPSFHEPGKLHHELFRSARPQRCYDIQYLHF